MKHSFVIAMTVAAPLSVLSQTTVFSDNFLTDATTPLANYLSAYSAGTPASWANTTGITLASTSSGQLTDLVGSFTPQTLVNAGDYISFVVNFNSPNIGAANASSGSLTFALDNSQGVSLLSLGTTQSESSSATGGTTDNDLGYMGIQAFNTTPKTGTKFYAKMPAGTARNNLSYYSNAGTVLQTSTSVANANNAVLSSDSFTLTYTVTSLNAGATQMQITEQLYDNTLGHMEDNFSLIATNGAAFVTPTSTFDTFDIGQYSGGTSGQGYTLNLTSISVVVPEPSTLALTGLGLLGLAARYRRSRS